MEIIINRVAVSKLHNLADNRKVSAEPINESLCEDLKEGKLSDREVNKFCLGIIENQPEGSAGRFTFLCSNDFETVNKEAVLKANKEAKELGLQDIVNATESLLKKLNNSVVENTNGDDKNIYTLSESFTTELADISIDEKNKIISHPISSERVNTKGYGLLNSGMISADFMKNPIVLNEHYQFSPWSDNPPPPPSTYLIGKCLALKTLNGFIIASTKFVDTELGNELFKWYATGFLNAWSLRWRFPLLGDEDKYITNMIISNEPVPFINSWLLREYSSVTLPSNLDAVGQMLKDSHSLTFRNMLSKKVIDTKLSSEVESINKSILLLKEEIKKSLGNTDNKDLSDKINQSLNDFQTVINNWKLESASRILDLSQNLNGLESRVNEALSRIPVQLNSAVNKLLGRLD